jgi:hypothetical protein
MSIQQNFPATRPSLNLNFARSQKLDPRITFTRTSSATRVNSDGLIEVVPANSPRFDFDPISGESLGLLVEEQRANLVVRSEEFQTTWIQFRATVNSNASVAPNGEIAADTIVEDSTPDSHGVLQSINGLINATTYSASCYFKASGRDRCRLLLFGTAYPSGTAYADFNLTSVTSTPQAGVTASITNVGRGWYRCSITATTSATGVADLYIQPLNASGAVVYLGNGAAAIDIWGAQLEVGAFPTSYIPTTTSTVTRTADNASITGSNFSDFYNPSEGTIYCSANNNPGVTTTTSRFFYAFERSDGTTADFIRKWIWTGNTGLLLNSIYTSNSGPVAEEFNTTLETTNKRTAIAYKQNDFARSYNGSIPSTDNIGNLSVGINQVRIGTNLSGHISQLTYYPTRLSNQVLQTLTK